MKNKKDFFLNIGLVLVFIVIGILVYTKFIKPQQSESSFKIESINEVTVMDINGNELKLKDILEKSPESYILIVEISGCHTCIHKGINDLIKLKKSGRFGFVIAIHDNIEEIAGWSSTFDFTPFYMMKKTEFFDHISTRHIPVFVKMKGTEIKNHMFITP